MSDKKSPTKNDNDGALNDVSADDVIAVDDVIDDDDKENVHVSTLNLDGNLGNGYLGSERMMMSPTDSDSPR